MIFIRLSCSHRKQAETGNRKARDKGGTSKVSYVKIEARGIEGPVVTVTISGLEIAGGLERRRVPQAAP